MADKWTPGPWVANDVHGGSAPWRIEVSADVWANDGWIIADLHGPDAHANARLISKAPELVDALRMVLDEGHSYESEGMARDYARDLLREIEGE